MRRSLKICRVRSRWFEVDRPDLDRGGDRFGHRLPKTTVPMRSHRSTTKGAFPNDFSLKESHIFDNHFYMYNYPKTLPAFKCDDKTWGEKNKITFMVGCVIFSFLEIGGNLAEISFLRGRCRFVDSALVLWQNNDLFNFYYFQLNLCFRILICVWASGLSTKTAMNWAALFAVVSYFIIFIFRIEI